MQYQVQGPERKAKTRVQMKDTMLKCFKNIFLRCKSKYLCCSLQRNIVKNLRLQNDKVSYGWNLQKLHFFMRGLRENLQKVQNMFKVNSKNTRKTSMLTLNQAINMVMVRSAFRTLKICRNSICRPLEFIFKDCVASSYFYLIERKKQRMFKKSDT